MIEKTHMKKTLILGALFVCCVCWVPPQSMADVDSHIQQGTSADPSEFAPKKFIDVKPIEEMNLDHFEEFFGRIVDEIRISGTRRTKDETVLSPCTNLAPPSKKTPNMV